MVKSPICTAFVGTQRLASGSLEEVTLAVKRIAGRDRTASPLVFDDATGRAIDLDLRGTDEAAVQRLESHAVYGSATSQPRGQRGPGRPKLGVVAREVTLLPRHWDWLASQPGGASVALRKLVEHARRANGDKDRVRMAREVAYRFMSAMAGDLRNLEEASRALFAGEAARFYSLVAAWPEDIRDHTVKLAVDGLA